MHDHMAEHGGAQPTPTDAALKPVLIALAVNAVALPALLAYNLPPSSTFLNQAAALIGRGVDWVVILDSAGQLVHYVQAEGFF